MWEEESKCFWKLESRWMNGTDLADLEKLNSLLTVEKAEKLSHCRLSKRFRNWLFQVPLEMRLKVGLKIGGLVESFYMKQLNPQLYSQANLFSQCSGLISGVGTNKQPPSPCPQSLDCDVPGRRGEGASNLLKTGWLRICILNIKTSLTSLFPLDTQIVDSPV